ncbi:AAA family ATPase [Comamonas sp.]|uniref:AAA family ATPase n=1 Tax=Comamonas sp. TaxID=34028 RepID=UPI0025854B6A|nr:AAA family ATPase [Comamonas sp.]
MSISNIDLIEFADAALSADYTRLRRVGQRLSKAIEVGDPEAARRFRLALNRKGVPLQASGFSEMLPVDNKSRLPLIEEHQWPDSPLFLDSAGKEQFSTFLVDVQNYEKLAAAGIASKHSLLLSGPPGTGKTLLAGHIAAHLGRKLYVVRLDSLISSLLGDTAKNIRSVFDFVAGKNAVLFLDELDAVAKMRDDRAELGELKRVVNTVIQGIDSLDSSAIVIAATNHPQMLDSAIWRRFHYKLFFNLPDSDLRAELWAYFLHSGVEQNLAYRVLSALSEGLSGADIEQRALAARRLAALSSQEIDVVAIAESLILENQLHSAGVYKNTNEIRKRITRELVSKHNVSQADVGRFLGITRQAISTYLKA